MSGGDQGREVRREIYIDATPATVFALLTDARQMTRWLVETVEADPAPRGVFRLSEAGGKSIEGSYIEVHSHPKDRVHLGRHSGA